MSAWVELDNGEVVGFGPSDPPVRGDIREFESVELRDAGYPEIQRMQRQFDLMVQLQSVDKTSGVELRIMHAVKSFEARSFLAGVIKDESLLPMLSGESQHTGRSMREIAQQWMALHADDVRRELARTQRKGLLREQVPVWPSNDTGKDDDDIHTRH